MDELAGLQRDGNWTHKPPPYGSSTGVLKRKCCESVSFRDIYIFYEKKKTHLETLIQIQAFELLVFTRLQSKATFRLLVWIQPAQQPLEESCLLGCYLIYL